MTARRRPGGTFTEPGRARHIPVLLSEVIASLRPVDGATYIDATFGAGGYTRGLLESARCSVLAIDRDPGAAKFAQALEERFPGQFDRPLFQIVSGRDGQSGVRTQNDLAAIGQRNRVGLTNRGGELLRR